MIRKSSVGHLTALYPGNGLLSFLARPVQYCQPLESPQRADDIHRDCLFYRDGSCKKCIERCPADAISEQGHDKQACAAFVLKQAGLIKERYGIDIYGCGLCQTGVSCERRIPAKAD